MKECPNCHRQLPLEEFNRQKQNPDGLTISVKNIQTPIGESGILRTETFKEKKPENES